MSLSRGMVSRLRRGDEENAAPVIYTDAAVLPGFSGGGLFDRRGRLIGILKSTPSGRRGFSPRSRGMGAGTGPVGRGPETRLAELSALLKKTQAALEASEREGREKGIQIVNLSQRLNAALAGKVQELASFRSEFFGRLRRALGNRSDVRIVGDRFVFQSEVLFPSGQATLQPGGREQIDKIARIMKEVSPKIPADIDWVLRVDGHTDRATDRDAGLPVELGALDRARGRGGQVPDRPGGSGQPARSHRVRRVPADRYERHDRRLQAQPADRVQTHPKVSPYPLSPLLSKCPAKTRQLKIGVGAVSKTTEMTRTSPICSHGAVGGVAGKFERHRQRLR